MIEDKKFERILVNKKALMAFRGKKCGCFLCKHTKCTGDVTHIVKPKLFLCAHCAGVAHRNGFKVLEMYF